MSWLHKWDCRLRILCRRFSFLLILMLILFVNFNHKPLISELFFFKQMPLTFLCDHCHWRLFKKKWIWHNLCILSSGFDAWSVTFWKKNIVSFSIQYCFIKVFLKALIVCIFYEHFVLHVYTLSRFIWCNK